MGSSYGTVYKDDICINISDSSRNGEYESYSRHSYQLDNSLELRGIPKLDANNNLYYDGDIYDSDGTVTRKYGVVDAGTLNWQYDSTNGFFYYLANSSAVIHIAVNSAFVCAKYAYGGYKTDADMASAGAGVYSHGGYVYIKDSAYTNAAAFKTAMSGVYLVYELATPTTEQATPYANPQLVDSYGTEEYVTTGIVPVGHETTYAYSPTGTGITAEAYSSRYITAIDENGIRVHPQGNTSNYTQVNADGMEVYKGGSSVAAFGVETRIGQQGASRVELTSNTIALIDENGNDALRAVTSGKEISQISTINTFYIDLPSNTSNNVFTIDLSGVASNKPFYVDIDSVYGFRFTVSTATSVGSSDYLKKCDSVRLGFTKGASENPKQTTVKMVDGVSPQPQGGFFSSRVDKTVTVAYNVSNSTITITTPAYPTIADSQLVEQYQTRYVTNGRSYLVLSVVSAYFSEYIPQTEIYGRTYLDMNTGVDVPDDIDESILASLNTLGWTTYCTQ